MGFVENYGLTQTFQRLYNLISILVSKDWKSMVEGHYQKIDLLEKCFKNGLLSEQKWSSLVQNSKNFHIENVELDFLKILISRTEKHHDLTPLHVASEHGNLDLGKFSKLSFFYKSHF